MLAEITSQQFTEWQASYDLDPAGPVHEDLRIALIVTTLANQSSDKVKIEDVMRILRPRDYEGIPQEDEWRTWKRKFEGLGGG